MSKSILCAIDVWSETMQYTSELSILYFFTATFLVATEVLVLLLEGFESDTRQGSATWKWMSETTCQRRENTENEAGPPFLGWRTATMCRYYRQGERDREVTRLICITAFAASDSVSLKITAA
jgi:hypothetical protein